MKVPKDWSDFAESLNSAEVEYLIVGAVALFAYGIPRFTGDIDFFVRPSVDNASRLKKALEIYLPGATNLDPEDFCKGEKMITLGIPPLRVDILNSITGVTFEEAWAQKVSANLGTVPIWIISFGHLKQNKQATNRPKDMADIEVLKKMEEV